MPKTIDQRYEIRGPALKGGMGTVFRAFDLQLERVVALKRHNTTSSEEIKKQALKEARLLAEVNHPSIVKIHDIVIEEGEIWQVSEWVEAIREIGRAHV